MREINRIILHCSDTPDDDNSWNVKRIRDVHVNERGWKDIGYHFVITRPEGLIQFARPAEEIGAHCESNNHDSIGVCWIGRNVPTDDQLKSLKFLLCDLLSQYNLTIFDVYGHHDFNPKKTCPNISIGLIRLLVMADFDWVTLTKKKEGK